MSELQHYGVPGMKWGHRKTSEVLTPEQRKANKSRARKALGAEVAGVAAVGGVALGLHFLSKKMGAKVPKNIPTDRLAKIIAHVGQEAYDNMSKTLSPADIMSLAKSYGL